MVVLSISSVMVELVSTSNPLLPVSKSSPQLDIPSYRNHGSRRGRGQ